MVKLMAKPWLNNAGVLVEQQPPQGVFVCDHAGLVINKFSLSLSGVGDRHGGPEVAPGRRARAPELRCHPPPRTFNNKEHIYVHNNNNNIYTYIYIENLQG